MNKATNHINQSNLSYELYKELASEICEPINDKDMTLQVRYNLYTSKLSYLYEINEQCFKFINSNIRTESLEKILNYNLDDYINIQNAIKFTKLYLKNTIIESFILSIKLSKKKGLNGF